MITDNGNGLIALQGSTSSYVIDLVGGAIPCLWHWGHRIDAPGGRRVTPQPMPYRVSADPANPALQLESMPLEYALHGTGDFRRPSLHAVDAGGFPVTSLRYRRHRIAEGAPALGDLPAVHAPASHAPAVHAPAVHGPANEGTGVQRL
ncbi:MAG: glycoside hydrolase family 36 N-terminal domain-containing protein, partial [bacterium]